MQYVITIDASAFIIHNTVPNCVWASYFGLVLIFLLCKARDETYVYCLLPLQNEDKFESTTYIDLSY